MRKPINCSLGSISRELTKSSTSLERKLDKILLLSSAHSHMEKRGADIYAQACYRGVPVNQADIDELVDAFIKMEQAHLNNDILSFGLYAYKQIESLANNLINNTPVLTIEQDLIEANGYNTMLIHKIFSFYNANTTGKNYDKEVIDYYNTTGRLPALDKSTFNNKIRYFIWYFDFKITLDKFRNSNKNKFYFSDNPFQYMRAARNRIHGGSINNVSNYDLTRLNEIEANKGKFFLLFNTILYDFHRRFFNYTNLI